MSKKLTSSLTAVLWAQRSSASDPERNYIYLTISAPDVLPKSLKVDLKPKSLTFTGHSETKKTTYHVQLDFYAEIDVEVRILSPRSSSSAPSCYISPNPHVRIQAPWLHTSNLENKLLYPYKSRTGR